LAKLEAREAVLRATIHEAFIVQNETRRVREKLVSYSTHSARPQRKDVVKWVEEIRTNKNTFKLSETAHGLGLYRWTTIQAYPPESFLYRLDVPLVRTPTLKPGGAIAGGLHRIMSAAEWEAYNQVRQADKRVSRSGGIGELGFHHGDFSVITPIPKADKKLLEAFLRDSATRRAAFLGNLRRGGMASSVKRGPVASAPANQLSGAKRLQKNLNEMEGRIVNSTEERGAVFNPLNGEKLLEVAGTKTALRFTPDEAKRLIGNVFTHNHPSGASFSLRDVKTAFLWDLFEMRAVGENYLYVIRPNGVRYAQVRHLIAEARTEALAGLRVKMVVGEMSRGEVRDALRHDTWSILARKVPRVDYRRVSR